MRISFTKMEGCGNDYVYISGFDHAIEMEKKPALVRRLSDRHFGIGGDGVIFINPSEIADFEMEMWNADGTRGEMCGNGIRCVGKFVYDRGMTDQKEITVESFGKVRHLSLYTEADVGDGSGGRRESFQADPDPAGGHGGAGRDRTGDRPPAREKVLRVRVNMGAPILEADQIPVAAGSSPVVAAPIHVGPAQTGDGAAGGKADAMGADAGDGLHAFSGDYEMTCVSMGNPHAVVYVDDVDGLEIEKIGPLFENHARFPNRTNTEFVEILDESHVKMRVWERGSGETLACGTGCCAVCVAGVLNGFTSPRLSVQVLGGELAIEWDAQDNVVWMTGPATTVFEGTILWN